MDGPAFATLPRPPTSILIRYWHKSYRRPLLFYGRIAPASKIFCRQALLCKARQRGTERIGLMFTFVATAYALQNRRQVARQYLDAVPLASSP